MSAFPVDGRGRWAPPAEKRALAREIPGRGPLHPVQQVRADARTLPSGEVYPRRPGDLRRRSSRRCTALASSADDYTIQVAPDDCTGCGLCVEVCPVKDRANPRHKAIDMAAQAPLAEPERANYDFFLALPELDWTVAPRDRRAPAPQPLFEYSRVSRAGRRT